MEPLRPDAGDAALAAACLASAGAIGDLAVGYRDSVVERTATIDRHRSPVPGGLWNAVTRTELADGEADEAIAEALRWFGGSCRWLTGPSTSPRDLGSRLVAAGFEEEDIPGMACDLTAAWDAPDPPGLQVERAVDRAGIDAAMTVFDAVFGPGKWVGAWADVFAWFLERPGEPVQLFVGREAGEPVTCGWLARGAGVAGIYGVQTLESRRGRGFGAALTRAPMRAGRDAGDLVAVLQASPLAAPLYERLGFREVCRIGFYER